MKQILTDGLAELGVSFSDEKFNQFRTYYDMLTEKNEVMNLTAIKGEVDTAHLHFLDCAALLSVYDFAGKSAVDIGTGAGFPGIPLKILQPDIALTLLDSHGKRMAFVEDVCNALDFQNTRCVCERAEDVCGDIGGSFDIAVSRAVARLNILCELCLPFVHIGGVFIAMKGPDCTEELAEGSPRRQCSRRRRPAGQDLPYSGNGRNAQCRYHPKNRPVPAAVPPPLRAYQKSAAVSFPSFCALRKNI